MALERLDPSYRKQPVEALSVLKYSLKENYRV